MSLQKKHKTLIVTASVIFGLLLATVLIYQLPPVKERLAWRVELAEVYLRGVFHPAGAVPTPISRQPLAASPTLPALATPTAGQAEITPAASATPQPTVTPLPGAVSLPAPAYELQTMNNCGPASLTMYLRYYGWEGSQEDISAVVKPVDEDRNVNPEELVYFVRTHAGWLNAEFRVGGDVDLLRELIAGGFPVLIEESFHFEEPFWPNDDLWAAHYLLLTGYDDTAKTFTVQDSYYENNHTMGYQQLDREWQIFNRVYLLVYLPARQAALQTILGESWEADANRQHALGVALAETQSAPDNAFAWFNLGSNLVYFERYAEAATAYDTARTLGLPQRMLRYQFGPFFAYFHAQLNEDLLALSEYALERTPNSEEALLWHGWALYRQGETGKAIEDWRAALEANPTYLDARYALDFVGAAP